jgi:hypothetical protein
MRRLQIKFFEVNKDTLAPICRRVINCGHLDASKHITILTDCTTNTNLKISDMHIPEKIDHFNIYEGMITIYYQDSHFLEITRIND